MLVGAPPPSASTTRSRSAFDPRSRAAKRAIFAGSFSKAAHPSATISWMTPPTSAPRPRPSTKESRARHLLVASTTVVATGVLLAGTVTRSVGGVVTLVGWVLGILGLHIFGRLGRVIEESSSPGSEFSVAKSPEVRQKPETGEEKALSSREDD